MENVKQLGGKKRNTRSHRGEEKRKWEREKWDREMKTKQTKTKARGKK